MSDRPIHTRGSTSHASGTSRQSASPPSTRHGSESMENAAVEGATLSNRRSNQHLPTVPEHIIRPTFDYYHFMGMGLPEILRRLKASALWDHTEFGLSKRSLERYKTEVWKLPSTRGAGWNVNNVGPFIEEIREGFPSAGAMEMKKHLLQSKGMPVSKKTIVDYMRLHHAEEVASRRVRCLKRKQFYAAGVNDIWTFDQHDKWRKFELFLHVGLEPISGRILWLKIWWTDHNPQRICQYWVDAVKMAGGAPLITQSDAGSENYGIANAQTIICHAFDATLGNTLQHQWMTGHQNVKLEIFWSQMQHCWTSGYEELLDTGYFAGIYKPVDPLHQWVPLLTHHTNPY
ncbi:hypothetical protein FRB95_014461 [Tulasnella sp. JGI-2019a]|nr:hypothetical protein FRB95_014461 [Tulasnella sp. JGI-2019a]